MLYLIRNSMYIVPCFTKKQLKKKSHMSEFSWLTVYDPSFLRDGTVQYN
jgi:hypothetical protein